MIDYKGISVRFYIFLINLGSIICFFCPTKILQTVLEPPTTMDNATAVQDDDMPVPPEQLTLEKETQTTMELVHCACCSKTKPKARLKNSSFQWNGRPKMIDKGNQIFPESSKPDEMPNAMPVDVLSDQPSDEPSDDSSEDDNDYDDDYDIDDDQRDPDYIPCEEEDEDDFELNHTDGGCSGGRKFLVFEEELLAAFSTCLMCGHPTTRKISAVIGTFCRIKQYCMNCNFERLWSSQPIVI
ncbi:uncharacterized protein LOC117119502 [Anneissia japonica]|uniref:uncharacterized protein LOC117119502 n=1 Tax=Anneissia japonica TaxID=1529436 RepID=UPI001425927E|nr:uncharacterized protein LOC117119502 [Anneissia japonica]